MPIRQFVSIELHRSDIFVAVGEIGSRKATNRNQRQKLHSHLVARVAIA